MQSFGYFSHNHFDESECSFPQGSSELLGNFYKLIKPLGNIKVLGPPQCWQTADSLLFSGLSAAGTQVSKKP